jgi:hypothetical protein
VGLLRYLENRIRGWLPEEPNRHSVKRPMGQRSLVTKRVLIIFLSFSLVCVVLVAGCAYVFLSWYSEQTLENLKGYSARLEDDGFIVEVKPLTEVNANTTQDWYWFGDFRSFAKQEKVTHIYVDYEMKGFYYLTAVSPTNDSVAANIFYYNKVFE